MVKFLMMSAKKATPVATGEKLVVGGGAFWPSPSWIGLREEKIAKENNAEEQNGKLKNANIGQIRIL